MNTPKPGPRLTPDEMHAVLTDWHAHYCDDPLYIHLETSFEQMADILWSAMKALYSAQVDADSQAREDKDNDNTVNHGWMALVNGAGVEP